MARSGSTGRKGGALLRHSAPQHQPTDPCTTLRFAALWVYMHIQVIPNRGSPPAILLRESYREGGKVKKRTLFNLTHWPPELLEGFKALLKGGTVVPAPASPEVFAGDTADPMTLSAQVAKLKERFGLAHVVLVGDRGLITQARIDADLAPAGLDWITALRAPAICGLVEGGQLQLSLFDE